MQVALKDKLRFDFWRALESSFWNVAAFTIVTRGSYLTGRRSMIRELAVWARTRWPLESEGRHTRGDMLQGHVAGKNFMRCSHEGACCGDRFLEVFTRRVLSQGHIVISFSDWFIFMKCRGDMLHEQFTRGDLACNRGSGIKLGCVSIGQSGCNELKRRR